MPSQRAFHSRAGQATVELALVLPVVVTLGLGVLQAAQVGRDALRVTHAARAAARAAAVGFDDATVRRAAAESSGLAPERLDVAIEHTGDLITVRVRYKCPTDVVLVGSLTPPVVVADQLTMRSEAA